ncbi:MAG: molybdopterin oxidoreductase family protein [Marmoricola sp.]
MTRTDTHCPYCALQCGMHLEVTDTGDLEVSPRDFPTNRGGLCQKGWTSARVLTATDRLTTPLLRDAEGVLQPATWDHALGFIADRVREIQAESGKDAVAVFGSGGLTNEKAYQLGKFARLALGTRHIDYNGRFCMSSAAAASNRALGLDRGLPFPLADVGDAAAVLLLGSNVADTMPPLVQHLGNVREAGGLIVVDPRHSATAALTDGGAGVHLQPLPGSDLALLLGLLHIVVAQGWADEDYLAARTVGWDEVRRSVSLWWPARVASRTGVPEARLYEAAEILAKAAPSRRGKGAIILTGRGVEQHADGTDTVTAAINLALALGLPGRPQSGYGCLTDQGNGQGGREHGQKADQLPGYRSIDDLDAREHVAAVWGVDPAIIPGRGVPAVELLGKLGGEVRALFVHGANPVVSAPDASAVQRRMAALDLVVVCDFVPSETTEYAHVVLPVTQWAEEEGTMTSLEGRVLRRRKAVDAPAGVRSELEILAELAARLDAPGTYSTVPAEVFDELARASAGGKADYAGLSHQRLDDGTAYHWPAAAAGDSSPRVFADRFGHPDGRARMVPVSPGRPADDLRAGAPVYLVTGRVLSHYQSGAQTRRVRELVKASPEAFVELHPSLAQRHGLDDGDLVQLSSERGDVVAAARISRSIRPDTVFMPFHWPGAGSANIATNDATDPISGMPEFKVCAVQISKREGAAR